ncbi:MAG: pantoate--beta-alanine ligase [Solirubrobacteraceae bacterium]|nr:pantoate--beta-alanine ligase [Solirubrobacteraceae bacterium]
MRTVRTVAELREALAPARRDGATIGLVPTMGALHAGHLSLIEAARAGTDVVVVSLFVNPTQFAPDEDLDAYPRDEAGDARAAEGAGADVLFAPSVAEVYPDGFATTVRVAGVSDPLEGARRPGHFDGVATVVTKLLNMVQPDVAYFGRKDAQQLAVIRRLVADLNLPVRIEGCPTVREPDGLAMSSRNAYLAPEDRPRALALSRALEAAREAVAAGTTDAAAVAAAARVPMDELGVEPEYLAVVDPETFQPVTAVDRDVLVAVAARVGRARLIDNATIRPDGSVP